MARMDVVRIVIGIILIFFFIAGLRRGLIRQVFDVLGIIAAFIGSFYLAHRFALYFENKVDVSYNLAMIFAAVLIFVGIIVLFRFIAITMQKFFKVTILGPFDCVMGGVFGAIKGAMLVSLILVIFLNLPFSDELHEEILEDKVTAAIYPVLPVLFDLVISHLPGELDFDKVAGIGKVG